MTQARNSHYQGAKTWQCGKTHSAPRPFHKGLTKRVNLFGRDKGGKTPLVYERLINELLRRHVVRPNLNLWGKP